VNNKTFIAHVGHVAPAVVPVISKSEWPAFPEPQKPSKNSPYRTVLWFHAEVQNGVRILVEGREKAAVEAYAKLVKDERESITKTTRSVDTGALLDAAKALENEAQRLRDCHTSKGEWDPDEISAKAEYDAILAHAATVRGAAYVLRQTHDQQ
jgi:hypothetical protein